MTKGNLGATNGFMYCRCLRNPSILRTSDYLVPRQYIPVYFPPGLTTCRIGFIGYGYRIHVTAMDIAVVSNITFARIAHAECSI